MQEQEANAKAHAAETLAYIAWEPSDGVIDGLTFEVGRTGDNVTHNAQTIDFVIPLRREKRTPAIDPRTNWCVSCTKKYKLC